MKKYRLSVKDMQHKGILYSSIESHDVISFDMFDTLVKRNVSKPKDIFFIVQKRYLEKTGNDIKDFVSLRREAEKLARARSENEEITLKDIYDILNSEYSVDKGIMNIEINVEQEYCIANVLMKEIYNFCIEKRKRIIIISDMYFHTTVLENILKTCGYDSYEKLYVSSEYLKTKKTGNLYDHVISDLQLNPRKILHIGDNIKSDILMPIKKGIHSWYIRCEKNNTRFFDKKDIFEGKSYILPCLNNNICKYKVENDAFKYGYELLGPLLIGFCLWIEKENMDNDYDTLYFLARDMYLVVEVYKKLTGKTNVQYLEVSRKSLRNAYVLKKGTIESILDTMSRSNYVIEDLLYALDISEESKKKIAALCGKAIVSKHIDELKEEELNKVNECLMMILKRENNLAVEFLKERGLFVGNNCLVDIGWHGTIQNMIEGLCDIPYNGRYFGNTKRSSYANMNTKGYWFDSNNENEVKEKLAITYILEVMLFPSVGTTSTYKKTPAGIKPVLEKNKYEVPSLIDDFQKGALKFVEDYYQQIPDKEYVVADIAVSAYSNFSFCPTHSDAEIFGNQIIEDGKLYKLCKIHSFKEYIKNPGLLVRDYKDSKWKEGYIKLILPFIKNPHRIACMIKSRRRN